MSLVRKLTAQYPAIRTLIAISLLLVSPFVSNLHVAALPMDHMQNIQSCTSGCVSNQSVDVQNGLTIRQDEKDTPAPPIDEPYYVQFQDLSFPKPVFPQDLTLSSSFTPPDLNLLHANFRF